MSNLGDAASVPPAQSPSLPSAQQKALEISQKLTSSGQGQNFARLGAAAASRTFQNQQAAELPFSGSKPSSSQLASVIRSNVPNENNQGKTIITLKTYSQQDRQVIKFLANPVISDSRDAAYDSISISHHPGEILKYRSTNSRTWGLNNIKLVSRTAAEATENLKKLNMIRSWVMPYYGQGTAENFNLMFGAPPPVLIFSAYGSSNIDEHPVVLLNYNFSYPNDVDYIECQTDTAAGIMPGTPFPALCDISINLKESFSPAQFSGFNLSEYRNGKLSSAYIPPSPISPPVNIKSSAAQTQAQSPTTNQSVANALREQKTAIPTSSPVRPLSDARFEAAAGASVEVSNIKVPVVKLGDKTRDITFVRPRRPAPNSNSPASDTTGNFGGGGASGSW